MDPRISQSLRLGKHLSNRNFADPVWVNALDQLVISSAYEFPDEDPFFTGPDNLLYLGFKVVRSDGIALIDFKNAIDKAIHLASGGVIYPGSGIQEWIYSPGDLVSLAICGTSAFQWQGDWGKDPVFEDYARGQAITIGRPNPEFLSPVAARCLESIMGKVFRAQPGLSGREPGIAVTRPQSRTRPEEASELMLNVFKSDFENSDQWESFQVLVRRFLPAHLARRLLSFEHAVIPLDRYFSLTELIEEGGMKPVEV